MKATTPRPITVTKVIHQSVRLPAPPDDLYDSYLDARQHAAITGGKVSVSAREGGKFTAFDGILRGRNLVLVPKRLIVQAWRSAQWKDSDLDSILILEFSRVSGGGRIVLTHANVPRHDFHGVTEGWKMYYWKPWRKYLRQLS
jgi:activator of HSP90 ATPase